MKNNRERWFLYLTPCVGIAGGISVALLPALSISFRGASLVAALIVVLTGLIAVGLRTKGLLGALLLVQAAYWILSFVIRPIVLLVVQPPPYKNDPIADPRLWAQTYSVGIGDVLVPVLVGLLTYVITIAMTANRTAGWVPRVQVPHASLVALLIIGWGFRLCQLIIPDSAVIITLASIGSVATGAMILMSDRTPDWLVVSILLISEMAWSYLSAVKAPIFALLLWLLLHTYITKGRLSARVILALTFAGVGFFSVVQGAKRAIGRLDDTSRAQELYPAAIRPLFEVITRFDLLNAASDSKLAGPGALMTPGEALTYALNSFIPQQILGADKGDNVGRLWGQRVSALSDDRVSGQTYLAQNPAAEGWAIAGWMGVIVECFLVAAVVLLVAWLLHSRIRHLALLGVAVTSQPYIFERGLLGISEGFGKGVQIALIATLLIWFIAKNTSKLSQLEIHGSTSILRPHKRSRYALAKIHG